MLPIHTKFKDREEESLRNSKKSMRWHSIAFVSLLLLLSNTMTKANHTIHIATISSTAGEAEALNALQTINEFKQLWAPEDMEPVLWNMLVFSIGHDNNGQTGNERAGQMFLYQKLNQLAKALQCVIFEKEIN